MHKRTKALRISEETKDKVWERDRGRCVWCAHTGNWSGWPGLPEAHFIPRSKSGLGIEQNILTLCRPCHYAFDRGLFKDEMTTYFRKYLQSKYPDWDEKKLYYHKEDY